jgi:hypothetical protein
MRFTIMIDPRHPDISKQLDWLTPSTLDRSSTNVPAGALVKLARVIYSDDHEAPELREEVIATVAAVPDEAEGLAA